eukprot:2742984-Prymnesium_polylepis.1
MIIRNKPRIVRRIVEFFVFFSEISASISLDQEHTKRNLLYNPLARSATNYITPSLGLRPRYMERQV